MESHWYTVSSIGCRKASTTPLRHVPCNNECIVVTSRGGGGDCIIEKRIPRSIYVYYTKHLSTFPIHFDGQIEIQLQIFAQILLTFRYGRDDEEVMGLKLSNESVLCVEQIYPLLPGAPLPQPLTKCQVLWKSGSVGHWRKCWCDHVDERLNDVILFPGSADEATRTKCSSRQLKTESRRSGLGPSSAGKRVPRCRHWHQLRSQNLCG